jgi:uncharacterized protein
MPWAGPSRATYLGMVAIFRQLRPTLLADAPLHLQVAALEGALKCNAVATAILEGVSQAPLPSWYLGAGGVAQTVWNQLHGFETRTGIRDYDIAYFDSDDLTAGSEQAREDELQRQFSHLGSRLDVTNEARVHLWYPERFGVRIPPYRSTEHAISTWPTTASSIGVRLDDGVFVVCAPFGLADLFSLTVRPNRAVIDEAIYREKTTRWQHHWPRLSILPW